MISKPTQRVAFATLSVLLLIGAALGIFMRSHRRSADEPRRLLQQAKQAAVAEEAKQPARAVRTDADATRQSSPGDASRARLDQITDSSGNPAGYAARLQEPLKEGESAELRLPEGGTVVIGAPSSEAQPFRASSPPHSSTP